jgi:hypothetical protein
VICLFIYFYSNFAKDKDGNVLLRGKEYFLDMIMEKFNLMSRSTAERIMLEAMESVRHENLVSVFLKRLAG